jgi:hypothetical protein
LAESRLRRFLQANRITGPCAAKIINGAKKTPRKCAAFVVK